MFSWSFMVSGFRFKSLIHFELIFVHGETLKKSFIFLHVAVPVFPTPFIEKTVLFLH